MTQRDFRGVHSPEIVNDIVNIEGKIREEQSSPESDKKKIARMRIQQFYRGLELNTGIIRTNNKQPY